MQLHKDSGQLRVIIDVSYESKDEFIDFIENEPVSYTHLTLPTTPYV